MPEVFLMTLQCRGIYYFNMYNKQCNTNNILTGMIK
jgi:hypothetical protein